MGLDFGFLSMDEIKTMAVEDRLKKFDGNQTKAADSLQIHVNSVANILSRRDAKPPSNASVVTQKDFKDKLAQQKEGYVQDPKTGMSVPVPVSAVPGIENIAKETFDAAKKRQAAREKEAGAHPHAAAPGAAAPAAAAAGKAPSKKK